MSSRPMKCADSAVRCRADAWPWAGRALLSYLILVTGACSAAGQEPAPAESAGGQQLSLPLPPGWFDDDAPPLPVPAGPEPPARTFDQRGINQVTFDDLRFEIEVGEPFEREMLTANIERLNGLKIRIKGYIRPSFKQSGLEKFVFVRDNQECCFGPGAALYDCILVEMARGAATDYSVRPVAVAGTFFIDEYRGPDGNVWAIFRMRDARVE